MLALPQNYMNNSGVAVKQILAGRNIQPEKLLIVYDDLDIPLGEIRIRKGGGPGTHKGMASIVGRIRECPVLDYKLLILSHNTVRGAAGAAILNAEYLKTKGLL